MDHINLDKIIKPDELDYNMILSVPEEIGMQIQKIIQGNVSSKDKSEAKIEIMQNLNENLELEDSRKLIFKINNDLLPVTILDMPCIIEASKTIDNKTFYKSGDVSQMLFVHDKDYRLQKEHDIDNFDPFEANDESFNKVVWKKDPDHKFKARSGLSKCTKGIRARRFKKKHRYNHEEILEVAKSLKNIIDNGINTNEKSVKNEESSICNENQSMFSDQNKSNLVKIGKTNGTFQEPTRVAINVPQTINIPLDIEQREESANLEGIENPKIEEYKETNKKYKEIKKLVDENENPNEILIKEKKKLKKILKMLKYEIENEQL